MEVLEDYVFIAIINAQASVAPRIRADECDQVIAQGVSTKIMLHITQFNGLRALALMGNVILANSKHARMSLCLKIVRGYWEGCIVSHKASSFGLG